MSETHQATILKIRRLREKGLSYQRIAQLAGVTKETAWKYATSENTRLVIQRERDKRKALRADPEWREKERLRKNSQAKRRRERQKKEKADDQGK